ncbi:hypothetical protein, partial [Salmonella enterica]|uniref:hypothetical protein n=1 Tax=Salmonella enterica TaxID=28901 RepID=UPI001BB08D4C
MTAAEQSKPASAPPITVAGRKRVQKIFTRLYKKPPLFYIIIPNHKKKNAPLNNKKPQKIFSLYYHHTPICNNILLFKKIGINKYNNCLLYTKPGIHYER